MTITVRAATANDAAFLAQTDLIATRSHVEWGFLDVALPGPESRRIRYLELMAVAEPRCWNHYTNFLVAELDGTPGAALCGVTAGPHIVTDLIATLPGVRNEMGLSDEEFAAGEERLAEAQLDYYPPDGSWVIEWVGSLPEFRRRGLVAVLLEAILEKGRTTGHQMAELAVAFGNTAAEKAYERTGFEAYEDVPAHAAYRRIMRLDGMRKMHRPLAP